MCCLFVSECVAAVVLNVLVLMCSLYTGIDELDTERTLRGLNTVHIIIIIIIIIIYCTSADLALASVGFISYGRVFASKDIFLQGVYFIAYRTPQLGRYVAAGAGFVCDKAAMSCGER